jgi:hypothetical protein
MIKTLREERPDQPPGVGGREGAYHILLRERLAAIGESPANSLSSVVLVARPMPGPFSQPIHSSL